MRKFLISMLCAILCAVSCGLLISASAETTIDGWEKADDGYFYEVDPVITDLFDYHETKEFNGDTAVDWYVVNYTGYLDNNTFAPTSRTMFSKGNNAVQSYFTKEWGENANKQALIAQKDYSMNHYKQSGCWQDGGTNELERHLDFVFNLDFTNLTRGWFTYVNSSTKVTFQLDDNNIIFEEKESVNELNYSGANSEIYMVSAATYGINLKELTGVHKISILIEDRVSESLTELTRNDNKGARITVTIDDVAITQTINKMGWYSGIFGFFNYTDDTLTFTSTKASVTFDSKGGDAVSAQSYDIGASVNELPTPTNKAYVFDGWYTTEDYQEGTLFAAGATITQDVTVYAKWSNPTSPNADGWVFNPDDGYYYEDVEPMDIFEFHETAEDNGQTACDWYLVNYTGYIDNNTLATVDRSLFTKENNAVQSYYTSDMGENAAKQILVAQYDWGVGYFKQSGWWSTELTSDSIRNMRYLTFNLDFTDMSNGWFSFINDGTKITFQVKDNDIIIEEKDGPNKLNYNKSSTETYFINAEDYGLNFKELTGVHTITVMIRERVVGSTAELTRDGNNGAVVEISIDNVKITQVINKLKGYAGIFAIANYTNAPLTITSTKATLSFDSNGGENVNSKYYVANTAVGELPTPKFAAYIFDGWYSSEDFAEGTKITAESIISEDMTVYAKWTAPASVNEEGWVFNPDDGYYYEDVEPMDIFEFHETAEDNGQTACDWYLVNYTGYIDVNTLTPVSRELFTKENNSIESYYTSEMGENAAKEILAAQYDWGVDKFKQGACWNETYTTESHRHMNYMTFNLDFTAISDGWISIINDSTKITIQFKDNDIIVEEKDGPNKLNYKKPSTETYFINAEEYGLNFKELTGVHTITVMRRERVVSSTAELTNAGNNGALLEIYIDDVKITQVINKLKSYAGIFAIANYTNAPLMVTSTKAIVSFETNSDEVVADRFVKKGETVDLTEVVPATEYKFLGWYTSPDFAEGTKVESITANEDITVYAQYGYTVTFMADGEQVGEVLEYSDSNKTIVEPEVPAKEGYRGAWETYELTTGNVVVNAAYMPINYTITFDGCEGVDDVKFNATNISEVVFPAVPEKAGYTGAWDKTEEDVTLTNMTVTAVYTIVTYTVTFEVDGETFDTLTFTVENMVEVVFPAIPEKEGYDAAWDISAEDLTLADVTVTAVYTEKEVESQPESDNDSTTSESESNNDSTTSEPEESVESNEGDDSVGCMAGIGSSSALSMLGLAIVALIRKKQR